MVTEYPGQRRQNVTAVLYMYMYMVCCYIGPEWFVVVYSVCIGRPYSHGLLTTALPIYLTMAPMCFWLSALIAPPTLQTNIWIIT